MGIEVACEVSLLRDVSIVLPKEREGERCFRLGATAYVQKSTDLAGFCSHWLP
jgi:hypothetical protein